MRTEGKLAASIDIATSLGDTFDMVIGTEALALGTFTFHGPSGEWEWQVDQSRLDRRKLEN